MSYVSVFINAVVVALMAMYVYEYERRMGEISARHNRTVLALERKLSTTEDEIKDIKKILSTKAGIEKLGRIENHLLKSQEKGVTYIRWGNTQCHGSKTETVYSGQVGGGLYTHSGGSVNYICLPNNPDATQPLKQHSHYAFLYGGEYEIFDFNQPQGIRSGIAQQDVACAACLVKGKMSSIMIPGRKTCYNGWTKEYDGLLMAGHPSHKAGSEYACVDSSTEVIAGGSSDQNGILFYPVKTVCGSLKCPPYTADTDVPCQVGGGHYSHSGASVNYICLPNDPDVAQPLKSHDSYAYLHGAEYEVFDYNTPQGIRSGIGQHDVACAACLAKEKTSSIMKPGRKTCYNGWTKEYEGILMAGYHSHAAASEFACEDRDAEAKAGGSKDENGILFYPVKTQCGSLNCPPYKHDTEVLCVICSK